ncbi:MAG: hypothetical protein HYT93_01840 [Parcubacteria group bacterium]|nr:hypothetical protein [Parcubacteria group bacterium]
MEQIDEKRRNFLKWSLIGGGGFLLGKIFGPYLTFSRSEPFNEAFLKDFRVVETGRELKLFNKKGEEVLVIDKETL